MTPISNNEKFIEGQDVEIQCEHNTIDMDNTLDLYLEDLREANKQADLRKIQMQTIQPESIEDNTAAQYNSLQPEKKQTKEPVIKKRKQSTHRTSELPKESQRSELKKQSSSKKDLTLYSRQSKTQTQSRRLSLCQGKIPKFGEQEAATNKTIKPYQRKSQAKVKQQKVIAVPCEPILIQQRSASRSRANNSDLSISRSEIPATIHKANDLQLDDCKVEDILINDQQDNQIKVDLLNGSIEPRDSYDPEPPMIIKSNLAQKGQQKASLTPNSNELAVRSRSSHGRSQSVISKPINLSKSLTPMAKELSRPIQNVKPTKMSQYNNIQTVMKRSSSRTSIQSLSKAVTAISRS